MAETLSMEFEYVDFNSAFKILSSAMNSNETHPCIKRDFRWMWKTGILNGILMLIFNFIVYCTIVYDLKDEKKTQAYANGILCLLFILAEYKICIILYYKDIIVKMIKNINLDYEKARRFPECEKNIIRKYIKKAQMMSKIWLIIVVITSHLFIVKSVGKMIYYTVVDKFRIAHLYEMTYPPALEDIKDTWGMFVLLYVIFLYFDIYMAITYIGLVPLGAVLALHCCGQLELAKSRVLTLFKKYNTDDEIIEQIKKIAKLLQDILSFIESIKVSFRIFYEITLKVSSLAIPVTLFQIIESMRNGELRVEFATVFFALICISSIPCYYSDMLMEAGKSLNLAIYQCGWETHWDPRSRKLLLLLMVRTSKSTALRTIFLEICLEALTGVFQMAYTIFNLLNAF